MSESTPLSEAEVRAFVDDWYLDKLDSHAPTDEIAAMVTDDVEFVLPETTFRGRDNFRAWCERIYNTFFDEVHTIEELSVTPQGDRADVKVHVNWQARVWQPPAAKSKWLGFDAYQTWEVRRSPETGRLAVQRYVVDRFEPMPGSSPL
jgi:ketosteroid isomerase-like protein